MPAKADFRDGLKAQRKAMPKSARLEQDARIAKNVLALPRFERADCLLTYLSFGSEVETRPIIEHAQQLGKTVAVPRCEKRAQPDCGESARKESAREKSAREDARKMKWFLYSGSECMERSAFGMEEPLPDRCREIFPEKYNDPGTIAIVPGLAFDEKGYRIGYGGGFYDTFLASFNGTSIGLCRQTFLFSSLHELGACEAHDKPVDIVITPDRIIGIH